METDDSEFVVYEKGSYEANGMLKKVAGVVVS